MKIRRIISNQVWVEYQDRGIVCPSKLQDHVFTTATINNLDHNLTYATAQSSLHGTIISIFQHAAVLTSSPPFQLNINIADRCTKLLLPESFIEIRPTAEVKPDFSQHISLTVSGNKTKSVLNKADTWLAVLRKDTEENRRTHFSAFYSYQAMSPIKLAATCYRYEIHNMAELLV